MIVENIPDEFKKALPILEKIREAGFEAYFVGGSVRDTLLGLPIHDVDIASSAYPEEIKQIFSKTVDTGVEHGTVMVLDHGTGYEITTFRTESTYQDYRRPDKVEFVRSLEEDLKRRDLTINALAMDDKGKIIDLFDGLKDLKNGINITKLGGRKDIHSVLGTRSKGRTSTTGRGARCTSRTHFTTKRSAHGSARLTKNSSRGGTSITKTGKYITGIIVLILFVKCIIPLSLAILKLLSHLLQSISLLKFHSLLLILPLTLSIHTSEDLTKKTRRSTSHGTGDRTRHT